MNAIVINSRGNANAFSDDSSYYLLSSLEVLDENGELERKADMFSKRTTTERMNVLLNKAAENEIDLPNALAYIQGGDASAKEARQDLMKVEQILNPDLSKEEALDVIDVNRENFAAN